MSLPDMGKTTLLGEQQEQWVLAFSPARLAGMGLDIQAVADAYVRKTRLSRQERCEPKKRTWR